MRGAPPGWSIVVLAWPLVSSLGGKAQDLVYPRRPSQTNVRYYDFEWHSIDILVEGGAKTELGSAGGPRLHAHLFEPPVMGNPWNFRGIDAAPLLRSSEHAPPEEESRGPRGRAEPDRRVGGVRLYFYEDERRVAELAAASIERSYRYLVEEFDFAPRGTFPYFLYSSYLEFLETDIFPIQEGVLGVTSPRSLEVALPYFGDHRLFERVSTHELAHAFTVQKLLAVAKEHNTTRMLIDALPLWFIEGMAEYYAQRGVDPEAAMLVRDMLINPRRKDNYVFGDFFEERLTSALWTYKVGQARCAFLEETYGEGTIQKILEETWRLGKEPKEGGVRSFKQLVVRVTRKGSQRMSGVFESWVKHHAYGAYVRARHDRGQVAPLASTDGRVQTLSASPDGTLIMVRSIDADTGRSRLLLIDPRDPDNGEEVAADEVPGFESLHPTAGRTFDLTGNAVVFVAQSAGRDWLYWQPFTRRAEQKECKRICSGWDVDLDLGDRRAFDLWQHGLVMAEAPSFSPDGRRVAFVGLSRTGSKDLYVLEPDGDHGDGYALTQLTHDIHAERGVSWGAAGVVFTSDATGHGKYNLFRIDPDAPGRGAERLTFEARDQFDVRVLPDGSVLYIAYDGVGANVYEWTPEGVKRHTDFSTGLFAVSPGPGNTIQALLHRAGRLTVVRMSRRRFLRDAVPAPAQGARALPRPRRTLSGAEDYEPLALRNWEPGYLFFLVGAGAGGVYGQVLASAHDRLRDHGLILSLYARGPVRQMDVDLSYINQEHRTLFGLGAFHHIRFRLDETFEEEGIRFVSRERFAGAVAIARYPFTRFTYLQGSLSAGAVDFFLSKSAREFLQDPEVDITGQDLLSEWREEYGGLRFQTELSTSVGFSTIRYHRATGPIGGGSILLETSTGVQPLHDFVYGRVRVDLERYLRLIGQANIFIRGGAGTTVGHRGARQYYLASYYTLRGVPFGDTHFLLGRQYVFTTLELQFPIWTISRLPLVDVEGVVATDVGAVADGFEHLWDKRVCDAVLGVNFGFAPLVMQLHFALPFDIGAPETPNHGNWVTNFSLGWRYQ